MSSGSCRSCSWRCFAAITLPERPASEDPRGRSREPGHAEREAVLRVRAAGRSRRSRARGRVGAHALVGAVVRRARERPVRVPRLRGAACSTAGCRTATFAFEYPPLAAPADRASGPARHRRGELPLGIRRSGPLPARRPWCCSAARSHARTGGDPRRAMFAAALMPLLLGALVRTHFDLFPVAHPARRSAAPVPRPAAGRPRRARPGGDDEAVPARGRAGGPRVAGRPRAPPRGVAGRPRVRGDDRRRRGCRRRRLAGRSRGCRRATTSTGPCRSRARRHWCCWGWMRWALATR